ncbi:hypothetical protein MASR2M15_08780 [Anaerolineales bacterium]
MRIRRDYSDPFFGDRRGIKRRRQRRKWLIGILLAILLLMLFLYSQVDRILYTVSDIMGTLPTVTPAAHLLAQEANQLFWQGKLQAAADKLAYAVEQRPDDLDYLYEYGQVLIDLGQPDTALPIAEKMLRLDPRDPRSYTLKVNALTWSGQSASAIPVGLTGLELAPEFEPLYTALSRAFTNEQRWRESQEYASKAIELNPNSFRAYWNYAWALSSVGEYDLAINELETTINLNGAFLPPYFELAGLYLAQDRNQDGIAIYEKILSVDSKNAQALLRLCGAYRKVGEFQRAIGFCEDAVNADPTYAGAQYQLGMIRYNERRFDEAQTAFSTCYELQSDNLNCYYRIGLTHYYLGNCDEAWKILENALIMAQSRPNTSTETEDIRAGLNAISSDVQQCGNRFSDRWIQIDKTEEATEEAPVSEEGEN